MAYSRQHVKPINPLVAQIYKDEAEGKLKKNIAKYDQKLYVKYLEPVENVKELNDFIYKITDFKFLEKKD